MKGKAGQVENVGGKVKHNSNVALLLPLSLDETDKTMLQILQDDFPIVQQPWLEVGSRLNISEAEVIMRLKRLLEAGTILRVGPIFEASKIGLKAATLVAMKVPENKVDDVANVINEYDNITHNYEREDKYNIWFTLAASDSKELDRLLSEIKQKTGIKEEDILDLPTIRRFKINVRFQFT